MESNPANPEDYGPLLQQLTTAKVGGNKGAIDRSQLVEAMLATRSGTEPPSIVAVDEDFVVNLATFAVEPSPFAPRDRKLPRETKLPSKYEQLVDTYRDGYRHQITVALGRRLRVNFHKKA
jgi:hypothetical protein